MRWVLRAAPGSRAELLGGGVLRMEGASSATQWLAGMGRRSLQTGWELFVLLTLISL